MAETPRFRHISHLRLDRRFFVWAVAQPAAEGSNSSFVIQSFESAFKSNFNLAAKIWVQSHKAQTSKERSPAGAAAGTTARIA
jgi:hypothetical protein